VSDERNLTPLRALPLLRELAKARGSSEVNEKNLAINVALNALEGHIAHGIAKAKRRSAKRKHGSR